MVNLRSETLERIGVTQLELNGMRAELARLDELCSDLVEVGQALEEARSTGSAGSTPSIADLELVRLERELESDVRKCLKNAVRTSRNNG